MEAANAGKRGSRSVMIRSSDAGVEKLILNRVVVGIRNGRLIKQFTAGQIS